MRTFAVMAAAGGVTWVLRATLIVLVPSTDLTSRFGAMLRYAAPAALASLTATTMTTVVHQNSDSWWSFAVATALAAIVGLRTRNITLTLASGMAAITLLTLT